LSQVLLSLDACHHADLSPGVDLPSSMLIAKDFIIDAFREQTFQEAVFDILSLSIIAHQLINDLILFHHFLFAQ
jgi:hypothetical protein